MRSILAIGLAVLLLAACTGRPEGVEPVRGFDITRYLGTWHEVMRLDHGFERGLSRVTAVYTARDDGSVGVLNRGFDARLCRWKDAAGRAVFQGEQDIASLSVTFFWPFAGGYHVIDLDRDLYQWALVSGPSRSYLWILARRPDLDPAIRARLVEKARALGFPVEGLILVDHQAAPSCPAGA
jgi:apolipoprotein D and lipocalin family protein